MAEIDKATDFDNVRVVVLNDNMCIRTENMSFGFPFPRTHITPP